MNQNYFLINIFFVINNKNNLRNENEGQPGRFVILLEKLACVANFSRLNSTVIKYERKIERFFLLTLTRKRFNDHVS